MSKVDRLLIYYGYGEKVFSDFVNKSLDDMVIDRSSDLCAIMKKQGSDKGLGWHNYTILYEALIKTFIPDTSYVFEVGIGTNNPDLPSSMGVNGIPGASLRGWREFLPNAIVVGADIDRDILFEEPGIRTYFVNQTDEKSISSLWATMPHISFDLMIDDGLHTFEANKVFLTSSIQKLKSGGLFVIEDVIMNMQNISDFDAWINTQGYSGFMLRLPYKNGSHMDNAVIVLCSPSWQPVEDTENVV